MFSSQGTPVRLKQEKEQLQQQAGMAAGSSTQLSNSN
jgi:hypothetical protein